MDRLWARIDVFPRNDPHIGRYHARQVETIVRFAPLTSFANIFNATLLGLFYYDTRAFGWLVYWVLALYVSAAVGLAPWLMARNRPPRASVSARAVRLATRKAMILGALWVVPLFGLYGQSSAEGRLLLACVTTGMICGGGFVLSSVPSAGYGYVLTLAGGAALALAATGLPFALELGLLLALYSAVVLAGIRYLANHFATLFLAETRASQQREVIGLLLRDFEESSSDVLWETDAGRVVSTPSPRLLESFGLDADRLEREPLDVALARLDCFEDARHEQPVRDLTRAFETGLPFRELVLWLDAGQGRRWWSVTAKPVRGDTGALRGWRGVFSDITEARESHRRLVRLAHQDSLTGLANRYEFLTRLRETLARDDDGAGAALLCVDLDGFKSVNDSLGHHHGDQLLAEVATRMRLTIGKTGLVARLGGDEFAILLEGLPGRAAAVSTAQALLQAMRPPCRIRESTITIGASIGVAMAPEHGDGVEALMTAADLAMYKAKADGKNRWSMFEPDLGVRRRRRMSIEQALQGAVARGEISLVYQPQVMLRNWTLRGFEALLRWHSPTLGQVSPEEFIAVAEESGQIEALGEWVLEQACREAASWPAEIGLAVNVSPVQARSQRLSDAVQRALGASGIAPARLEIEITESVLLEESPRTLAALESLRDQVVRFALDDFGTGYSSLGYLRRFPFDSLKIHGAFVHGIERQSEARAIVHTILGLAHAMRIDTVAEGVEAVEELAVLRDQGCDIVQGFLFARPMGAAEARDFIERWQADPIAQVPRPLAENALPA
ncbi:MAG: EAL domain-containing protein [Burkholderiaceae bacterium]